jgi:hypothetical protein
LLDGSFAALIRVPQLRSYLVFDAKRRYFFTQLRKMRPERSVHHGRRTMHLQLRRGQVSALIYPYLGPLSILI